MLFLFRFDAVSFYNLKQAIFVGKRGGNTQAFNTSDLLLLHKIQIETNGEI